MPILLALSLLLCWPILVSSGSYVFADSQSYLTGGARIWDVLSGYAGHFAGPSGGQPGDMGVVLGDLAVNAQGKSTTGRSFLYSSFAFAMTSLGGGLALAVAQAFLVLLVAAALIGPEALARRRILVPGAVFLIVGTSLPWFAVYVMPDILAAVPILFGAILVSRFDLLTGLQQAVVVAITAFAAASHYGHGPLMLGIAVVTLLLLRAKRQLSRRAVIACFVVVAFAPLANLTASTAVLKETSLAPKRLPILLARSLEDGPARWYLEESCPGADLAFCDIFGTEIPSNVGMFLWTTKGIDDITPAQLEAIRQEEFTILCRAFLRYPVQQSASLLRNAALQIVHIGTGNIKAAEPIAPNLLIVESGDGAIGNRLLRRFDRIVVAGTALGALVLLGLGLTGRLTNMQVRILAMTVIGLALNALIFGGLSAPVDRYQSRVIWIVPFLAVLFLASGGRPGRRVSGGS